jgi:hypothetical protein
MSSDSFLSIAEIVDAIQSKKISASDSCKHTPPAIDYPSNGAKRPNLESLVGNQGPTAEAAQFFTQVMPNFPLDIRPKSVINSI